MKTVLEESLALRSRYDEEPSHSGHVADLALQLFEGWHPWHRLGERPRELLHGAALLHDIGWSQTADGQGHHKWSSRLIQAHDWKVLSPEEVAIMAQVARYHRKSIPQPKHEAFQELPPPAQKWVMILGGILRQADALDRTHTGQIEKLTASVTSQALWVRVQAKGNWEAERAMFEAKREMLEQVAGKPVRCAAANEKAGK
jgi:exopolyphosphatase/guanosine-5'-triphosphate,3'-diphosphate pyrophosphatase